MSASVLALVGFATWTLVLLGGIAVLRTSLTLSGARAANSFSSTGADVSPFSERLCRAHANCYESFPLFGGLLIAAVLSQNANLTDPLALWVLAARVGQSTVHVISTSPRAVLVRFGFFSVQLAVMAWWAIGLLHAAAA